METTSILIELQKDLHDRLLQHIAANPDRYPDNGCADGPMDKAIVRAIELLLAQDEQLQAGRDLLRRMFEGRA